MLLDPNFDLTDYLLIPAPRMRVHRIVTQAHRVWPPDPAQPLEQALPDPWDETYRAEFRQDFQPVKFWSNANIIAHFIEATEDASAQARAREVLAALLVRLRAHYRRDGEAILIENRFDFVQPGVEIAGPWYSGIANAFAIFGLRRCMDVMDEPDLKTEIRGLANAYRRLRLHSDPDLPDPWISYVTDRRHLWFEEYPMRENRANLVLNGHIFALLALNVARHEWPRDGLARLIRAGAHSVAHTFPEFMRRGKTPLYSLRGPRKGDYLPIRTVRQQFELYLLTGDGVFLSNAMRVAVDVAPHVDNGLLRRTVDEGARGIKRRRAFELTLTQPAEPGPAAWPRRAARWLGRRLVR